MTLTITTIVTMSKYFAILTNVFHRKRHMSLDWHHIYLPALFPHVLIATLLGTLAKTGWLQNFSQQIHRNLKKLIFDITKELQTEDNYICNYISELTTVTYLIIRRRCTKYLKWSFLVVINFQKQCNFF